MSSNWKCEPCTASFGNESEFMLHNVSNHYYDTVARYICKFCELNFDTKETVIIHLLEAHMGSKIVKNGGPRPTVLKHHPPPVPQATRDQVKGLLKKPTTLLSAKRPLPSAIIQPPAKKPTTETPTGQPQPSEEVNLVKNEELFISDDEDDDVDDIDWTEDDDLTGFTGSGSGGGEKEKTLKTASVAPGSSSSANRMIGCELCGLCFNSDHELDSHMDQEHSDSDLAVAYRCNTCGLTFPSRLKLDQHAKLEHSSSWPRFTNSMPVVGLTTLTSTMPKSAEIDYHDNQANNDIFNVPVPVETKQFTCELCQSSFIHKFSLNRHMKTKHRMRPVKGGYAGPPQYTSERY